MPNIIEYPGFQPPPPPRTPPHQLKSVQVLHVIGSKPQLYHSVRINQQHQRAIHVLPEKYQFCAQNSAQFGQCRAKVHYGICSDYSFFLVNDQVTSNTTVAASSAPTRPLSPIDQSIVAKIEAYRENIGAALELLKDEPTGELEDLIRNFVREDRLRRENSYQPVDGTSNGDLGQQLLDALGPQVAPITPNATTTEVDLKGRKILLKKSQAELLHKIQNGLQNGDGGGGGGGGSEIPFLSSNREGVVQSRKIRFGTTTSTSSGSNYSREHSPSPLYDSGANSEVSDVCHHSPYNHYHSSYEPKTVFGISPKSSSLSRYKNLIESRSGGTTSPVNFAIGPEPNQCPGSKFSSQPNSGIGGDDGGNLEKMTGSQKLEINSDLDSGHLHWQQQQQQRRRRQNSGCFQNASGNVIDTQCNNTASGGSSRTSALSSATLSHPYSPTSTAVAAAAAAYSQSDSSNNLLTNSSGSKVQNNRKIDDSNHSSSFVHQPSIIDNFIKENEKFFHCGSSKYSENEMKLQSKLSSLTDDEKALLHETLKVGLYGATEASEVKPRGNEFKENPATSPPQIKTGRRIIFVSKPAPKPEPKPEPKYVNGKVVFGQVPVKPVLQRGSVAERVMLFEKCPEKTSVTKSKLTELQKSRVISTNKIGSWIRTSDKPTEKEEIKSITVQSGTSQAAKVEPTVVVEPKSPTISSIPIFRRFSRSNSLTGTLPGQLPRFYYPNGRPYSSQEVETQIKKIAAVFERFPSRTVTRKEIAGVLKLVTIPVYWKEPLFQAILANKPEAPGRSRSRSNSIDYTATKKEYITCEQFTDYWKKLITTCYDDASRFIRIITKGERNFLIPEDLEAFIQDVIDTHPGLQFLKEAEEFHSRYVHTVIARIFYCLDKTWSGQISLPELRKSNFLKVVQLLEEEDDINQITEYFSYEHFYVIYCKFWELDQDHDLFISKYDLSRHNDSALSSRIIDRIFSGAVTRVPRKNHSQMSYSEFVWFLLSEEDKRHPRAIEYWFRCMDLDGDGCLSFYELEYFYSEQVKRMSAAGIEALPFTDCLCQMIDLVSPKDDLRITLNDLKHCRLTPIFFDTFFNLEKYLDHEQRDPFASQRDEDGISMSDWDRYAAEEYELLVAEENAQNACSTRIEYPPPDYGEYYGPIEEEYLESSSEDSDSEETTGSGSSLEATTTTNTIERPPQRYDSFEEIDREFYEYLNTQFKPTVYSVNDTNSVRVKYPLNQPTDTNNNSLLDDDDFY